MRSNSPPTGTGIVLVTLLFAAILEVISLPASAELYRPHWLLMTLLYWIVAIPHRIGVFWGLACGLFLDVLLGTPLGQWGLAFAFAAFVSLLAHKRLRVFVTIQQSAVIFLFVGCAGLIAYLVQDAVGRTLLPPYTILSSALVSAILWHPLTLVLRWIQYRFLIM